MSSVIGLLVGFCLLKCWQKACCISYDSGIVSAMFPGKKQLASVKTMAKQIFFVNNLVVVFVCLSFLFVVLFLIFFF